MLIFKDYWILWQNARNLNFIWQYNTKEAKKLADSKLKTKDFLSKKGISVSNTLHIIKRHNEIEELDLDNFETPFVIKPNAWYGWKWILIIDKRDSLKNFITNNQEIYTKEQLKQHLSDILDWFYSLSWSRDKVIFEKKIELDHSIELLWKYWLPDVRVIVFNSIPVIAMLRIPTKNSKWKANLHAWACAAWIDIWSWKLTYITQFKKYIKSIPGIWDIRWIEIPNWNEILSLAVKTQQVSKIWYLWCDIVLDDKVWPMILEVNIRPGLEVQVANRIPLLTRLEKVKNLKVNSIEKWVRLWRDMFWWEVEEKIKNITGKKILWTKEYITFNIWKNKKKFIWKINPSKEESSIKKTFLVNNLNLPEKQLINNNIKLKTVILKEVKNINFRISESQKANIIIWKNSLQWYIVDPYKYKDWDLPQDPDNNLLKAKNIVFLKWYEEHLLKLDKTLMITNKKLNLWKITNPINFVSEKNKFIDSNLEYTPQFKYANIRIDTQEELTKVEKIEIPDIPLSNIYQRKKEEIINKIRFIQAFEKQNISDMQKYSKILYWEINELTLNYANWIISNIEALREEDEFLTFQEIKTFVEKFNYIYWINIILKQREMWTRFVMSWDILYINTSAKVWKRELRSIIAHEIEWHYLKRVNGKKSKYSIFTKWTAWYINTEEWIAIYNQSRFLTPKDKKYYSTSQLYKLINFSLNHNYTELIEYLKILEKNNSEAIFNKLYRLKKWLIDISKNYTDMKWIVYLSWYIEVLNFIENGWDIKDLYFWKISIKDLEDIKDSSLINTKNEDLKIPISI